MSNAPKKPAKLLTPLPQASPAYKRRVWLAVASLLAFMALYFVLAGWFLLTAYRLSFAADSPTVEGYLIAACSAFLAIMMLKPLVFVKHGGTEGSLEITRTDQPRLFAFLDELADAAQAPRPHRVFVSPTVNAAVFYDLSALNLIFPSKKNLEIGLGLVNTLTLGELRAVLAHEFGHFTQSSMAVFRWSYIAQQIAAYLVLRRDKLDEFLVRLSHWDLRVAWIGWLVSLIVWSIRSLVSSAFSAVTILQRALSREMEFQADLVAVSLTGSDALINALHRLQAADDSWDRTLGIIGSTGGDGRVPQDVFAMHSAMIDRVRVVLGDPGYGRVPAVPSERASAHRLFKPELAQPPKMWLTHPLNHEREANTKKRYVPAEIDDRSAWTLFDEPTALRERVTALMMGPEAKAIVPVDESLASLQKQFEREFLGSRYRGVYLGRSVARAVSHPSKLVEPARTWREQLDQLYPESLVKDIARLRAFEKELGQLRALKSGMLAAGDGGIRYRGREIKPTELPGAIERLERDIAAVEKRLSAADRLCRSVHMAAASEIGGGWAPYLEGLLAVLHYADHSLANLNDLHGVLVHTLHEATVTHRVSSAGRKRVLAAANELQAALARLSEARTSVVLDTTLQERIGTAAWTDMLERLELGPAEEDHIDQWLQVIDGWVGQASAACSALRSAALDQLLVTEAALAQHVRQGTTPEPAPAPSSAPAKYDLLLTGKEREHKSALNLWERFQVADGVVPAAGRLVAAAAIILAVLGFGVTTGAATITIYNGLNVPVSVAIDGKAVELAPLGFTTQRIAAAESHRIETRSRSGALIEELTPEILGSYAQFVYNVAGAAPMVEWTATYGAGEGAPERFLGAPRWSRTTAHVLFEDPPESISNSSDGGVRRILTGLADASPARQLSMLNDTLDLQRVIGAHARWDATNSTSIMYWLGYARYLGLDMSAMLAARLAEAPNDVVLLRFEQDMASGTAKDSVCLRHRARADAAPDDAALYYVASRCLGDEAAKSQAFLDGRSRWPADGWLAFSAGYVHAEAGRWEDALTALLESQGKVRPLASSVAVDAARISRMIGRDTGAVYRRLKASAELNDIDELERGGEADDSVALRAFAALASGALDSALVLSRPDSFLEARMLRLAAASEGASPELQSRALALDPAAGMRDDTRWAAIALALRAGKDYTPFLPPEATVRPQDLQRMMAFVELARGANPTAAEGALAGLGPELRGHAYSVAIVLLADRSPPAWREAAHRLLFGAERPYFRIR